jgi:hypothetical protein
MNNNNTNNNYMNNRQMNNNQMNNSQMNNNYMNNNQMNMNNINTPMNNNNINSPSINNYIKNQMTNNVNNQMPNNVNSQMIYNMNNQNINNNMTAQDDYYNSLCKTWDYYQFYRNMNNINNQNSQYSQNKMKVVNNNSNTNIRSLLKQNLSFNYDNSYNKNTTNIMFEAASGHKVSVLCSPSIKMKDLLIKYVQKIGVSENVIDNAIYFLFNGSKIKNDENRTLEEMGIYNCSIILVIDKNSVIGA